MNMSVPIPRLCNMPVDQRTQLVPHSQSSSNAQAMAFGVLAAAACSAATLAFASGLTSSLYTPTAPTVQAGLVTTRYIVLLCRQREISLHS